MCPVILNWLNEKLSVCFLLCHLLISLVLVSGKFWEIVCSLLPPPLAYWMETQQWVPVHCLSSSDRNLITVSTLRLKSKHNQAFAVWATRFWRYVIYLTQSFFLSFFWVPNLL